MFCLQCGTRLPDHSKFCNGCGAQTSTTPTPVLQRKVRPKTKGSDAAAIIFVSFFLVVAVVLFAKFQDSSSRFSDPINQVNAAFSGNIASSQEILSQPFEVEPLIYRYYTVTIESNWIKPRIVGNFKAAGGSGNDIEVFIRSQPNGGNVYYASGRRSESSMDVSLAPGTYYLVFNNSFSLLSTKTITGNIKLLYETPR